MQFQRKILISNTKILAAMTQCLDNKERPYSSAYVSVSIKSAPDIDHYQ